MIKIAYEKNKKLTHLVIIFIFIQAALSAGLAIAFQNAINVAQSLAIGTLRDVQFILIVVSLLLYILVLALFGFLARHFRSKLRLKVIEAISTDYHEKISSLSIKEYESTPPGYFFSRLLDDIPTLINDYVLKQLDLITFASQSIAILVVSFFLNAVLALILLPICFVIFLYTMFFRKKYTLVVNRRADQKGKYIIEFKSEMAGFEEVKYNNAKEQFAKIYSGSLGRLNKLEKAYTDLESYYSSGSDLLTLIMKFGAILAAIILFANDYMTLGGLAAAIYISLQIFDPLKSTFELVTLIGSNHSYMKSVYSDFDNLKPPSNTTIHFKETIKLVDVSFKFGKKLDLVLDEVNMTIEKNKSYLLLGPSGSGKSTLFRILTNSLSYSGRVLIDNHDMKSLSDSNIYNIFSYITETPYIFTDTIRRNIDLAGIATDGEILEVIEQAGLNNFMKSQARTLDTILDNDAFQLSASERQRIMLARALIRNTDCLLLDEATTSLDDVVTTKVEDEILAIKNKTILYICHGVTQEQISKFDYVIDFYSSNQVKVIPTKDYIYSI